jgi:hypothetical protein
MTDTAVDLIHPQMIVDAFGSYKIGIAQSFKGQGGPDDGRFMDLATPWAKETPEVQRALYMRLLRHEAKRRGSNFIEFWGWPEVRFRDGEFAYMIFSRVRFLHVIAVPPGRPN